MDKPDDTDPKLVQFADDVQAKIAELTKDPDYAVVCMVMKRTDLGLQTYTNVAGLNGLLSDGLYHELVSQIDAGNLGFFALLAEVIFDVEEEFALNRTPDTGLDDDSTIH